MTIQKFQNLLEKGWSLDHIFILENIASLADNNGFPRGAALLQTLFRKGMVSESYTITELGKQLLEYANNEEIVEIVKTTKPKIAEGIESLHKKLEDRIVALTGKKQIRVNVLGKTYPFLCNEQDLEARIRKVMIKYKLTDFQKIEDCLLGYIESCHKRKSYSPLIIYYIVKTRDGVETSQMVTDIRSWTGEETNTKIDFEI